MNNPQTHLSLFLFPEPFQCMPDTAQTPKCPLSDSLSFSTSDNIPKCLFMFEEGPESP